MRACHSTYRLRSCLPATGILIALCVASVFLLGCQSATQKADIARTCEGRTQDGACTASEKTSTAKPIYPKNFSRDPHARHKTKALAVALNTEQTQVTFSANNPDYKHRNYAHSVIAPQRHAPRVVRYNEAPGMARVRSGNLQFDALFSLAQTTLHKTSRQSILGEKYRQAKACDCFVLRDEQGESLWPLALAGDLALALNDPQKMQRSLQYYLSGFRREIGDDSAKEVVVPGGGDGFQVTDFAGAGDVWPLSADRIFWAWPLQTTLRMLPEPERNEFSREALRALRNTIEIDRAVLFDGSDGLYGSQRHKKSIYENLAYYHALKFTARLAKQHNDVVHSVKYLDWSVDLKNAINQNFWHPSAKAYQSHSKNFLGKVTFDWNAQAWAILLGAVGQAQQQALAAALPEKEGFNSPQAAAYSLRAAQLIQHSGLADRAYRLLVDKTSIQLGFGSPWPGAGKHFHHQHERVAASAYQNMVVQSLFGVQVQEKGLMFSPLITSEFRRTQFAGQSSIALYDVALRGRSFDIKIHLPQEQPQNGIYRIDSIRANGRRIASLLHWHEMAAHNTVVIRLGALEEDSRNYHTFADGSVAREAASKVTTEIKRTTIERIGMSDSRVSTQAKLSGRGGAAYLKQWGDRNESIHIRDIQLAQSGRYTLQWQYRNPAQQDKDGIAHGVKWLSVSDTKGNVLFGKAVLLPLQPRGDTRWAYSLPITASLPAGSYTFILRDFMNMSYLEANMTYTGKGGVRPANHADIRALRIERDGLDPAPPSQTASKEEGK